MDNASEGLWMLGFNVMLVVTLGEMGDTCEEDVMEIGLN